MLDQVLKVSEMFISLQGESSRAGLPCSFVRLSGCNLRCRWCDTQYAWQGGSDLTIRQILDKLQSFGCRRVEVTGGEPLSQPAAPALLKQLCELGYETLLETNGSLDISPVDVRVRRIVDLKCPSSGEHQRNLYSNAALLTEHDEVKFVIADRSDYDFARDKTLTLGLLGRCGVIYSAVAGCIQHAKLAEWILADRLDVRLGVQLHKIIWPTRDRGV